MNKVSYKEATDILGAKKGTVEHAVSRGDLTQIPIRSKVKYLLREQVEMFIGKRLSVEELSVRDRQKWEEYKSIALSVSAQTPSYATTATSKDKVYLDPATTKSILAQLFNDDRGLVLARGHL